EARTHFSGEDEVAVRTGILEVSDEQRTKADTASLRVSEAADHKVLRHLALHLQPKRRPTMLVAGVPSFCDDALPPLAARPLPRLRITDRIDALQRRLERQTVQ